MVSNQALGRSTGRFGGFLPGLLVLTIASGCQTPPNAPAPVSERPATAPVAVVAEARQGAVEAALAREAAGDALPPAASPPAAGPALRPDAPMSYTVQRGDTLYTGSPTISRSSSTYRRMTRPALPSTCRTSGAA